MANIILPSPIIDNADKFNQLVNLALNSKDCCCDNTYLKKLYAIFSLEYELERYYKFGGGDVVFIPGSTAYIRKELIEEKIISILNSICDDITPLDNITDNSVSYADMFDVLWNTSKAEYKLGKEKCWCNLLKTSLAFQINQTEELYEILNQSNKTLVNKIFSQSSTAFVPTVNTITVNNQVL